MKYKVAFAETVVEHIRFLTAAERKRVLDAIERQLGREPLLETRNRKPLRPNPLAPWELRVGSLRVFYEVANEEGYRPGSGHREEVATHSSDWRSGDRVMKKVKLSNASRSLAQYTTELEDDIVIVTEGDRPLAALVPLKNVDRESLALSTHPEFLKLVGRARKDFTLGKVVSLDEMRSRVGRMRSPNSAVQPTAGTRRRKKAVAKRRARRG